MAAISIQNQTQAFTINIPKLDIKRFKGLARVMGWTFEESNADYYESEAFYRDIDTAEQEIAAGHGLKVSSKEELDALFVWITISSSHREHY